MMGQVHVMASWGNSQIRNRRGLLFIAYRMVEETFAARHDRDLVQHGVAPKQLFTWRRGAEPTLTISMRTIAS
jgi:hypothetical protein